MTVIDIGEKAKSDIGENIVSGRKQLYAYCLVMWNSSWLGLWNLRFRPRLIAIYQDPLILLKHINQSYFFDFMIHTISPFLRCVSHILKYIIHCQ